MVSRCVASPEAKAVQEKMRALAQLERDIERGGERAASWRDVASGYRQRQVPAGFDFTKTRELTLPPPVDADRRRAEFAKRNDGANVETLAHRLFRSLDSHARGLEKPFALYHEKKFAAALDAFRDYFFDKLAHLEKYGVPADAVLTDERPPLGTPVIKPEWVADAMRGVATQPNRNVSADEVLKIHVGEPGAVNWAYVPFEPQTKQKMPVWLQVMRQVHILERDGGDATDGLRCWLIDAYHVTGEKKYLQRWTEYADDWALNMQRDFNALPVGNVAPAGYDPGAIRRDARQAPYCWNVRWYPTLIARQMPQFVTRLRALALTHPSVAREFPATTLARVLLTGLDEYLSPNILVARPTRFNWNMMGMGFNVRTGMLLGEFKSAQWAGREAARTFQNHALFSIMPDGGYVEYSDEGHQGVWMERATTALQLWQAQPPAWFDTVAKEEFKESITRNGEFFLRHLKPDGYRHRDDYRLAQGVYVGKRLWPFGPGSLDQAMPWVTDQPEPQRMLGTVFGKGEAGMPTHRSDVMPCLGEFMLRGGWGKDDPFLYMHSGRIPNSNPDEDCNAFKLHNFGRHLLNAQPVYVDGRTQNQHFKHVDNVGAKTCFLTYTDGQPIQGRWHTSPQFDLAEGVYEGAYEDREGRTYWSTFHTGGYDMKPQQRSLGLPAVTDVQRHTRQIFFIRQPVAWIVVDRVRTAAKHSYEVPFEFYTPVDKMDWLRRAKTAIPNAEKRVVIDDSGRVIRTDNPGFPKVAMQLFSASAVRAEFDPKSHDVAHKDSNEIRAAEREWKSNRSETRDLMAFVRRTLVKWSGEGDQLLVTFMTTVPSDSDANTAWKVTGEGSTFKAVSPDGSVIQFAASTQPAVLKTGEVVAEADTLLVVEPKGGEARGIALGARSLNCAGKRVALATDSVEFSLGSQPAVTRAIHAPIQPVTFSPGVNVFTESIDVSMACETPGVEIRYTLDGSEPSLDSPHYTKQIRLTQSAVVRAIAVRPGAKELRWPLDPGFATLPTRAIFTQQSLAPAMSIDKMQPGLAWQYAEGQMFALVANSDILPAQKTGTTTQLFDVSMRQGGNAFLTRYDGYLHVPADGVYTFHAPREFIIPDIDPGYDLRVFVDDQEWWPAMRWHALGTWSRALAKGPHKFKVIFTDTRTKPYKHETWQNWPNLAVLWTGIAPSLEITGPGITKQPIPAAWLKRDMP
ncbi:MAG: chitobiase/beta-hexosaminidase C-terminal domain-containing protein [bacterium]